MYKSKILPPAKEDILEAAKWYNRQKEGLGKIFTAEVRKKVLFIRQYPKSSSVRYKNVRTTVLNVFPFMIHYTVEERYKLVIISAVLHTSRDSALWKKR